MLHYDAIIEFEKKHTTKAMVWGISCALILVIVPIVLSFTLYALGLKTLGIAALFLMLPGTVGILVWARRLDAKEKSQKKPLIEAWARANRLDPNGELPENFEQESQSFRQGDNMYLLEKTENGPVLTRFAKVEQIVPEENIPERPVVKESVNDVLWKAARESTNEHDSVTAE